MPERLTRKVVTHTSMYVEHGKRVIACSRYRSSWFISKAEYNNWTKKHPKWHPISVIEHCAKYAYYNPQLLEGLKKVVSGSGEWSALQTKAFGAPALDLILQDDFDDSRVMRVDSSSNLFYRIGSSLPVSMPYYLHYIGGIHSKDYDLDKALKILERSDYVYDIALIDIPYYNQSPGYDKAISCMVLLPQSVHDRLVRIAKHNDPVYWTCRLKEYPAWRPYYNAPDVLGLKPAYKGGYHDDSVLRPETRL